MALYTTNVVAVGAAAAVGAAVGVEWRAVRSIYIEGWLDGGASSLWRHGNG